MRIANQEVEKLLVPFLGKKLFTMVTAACGVAKALVLVVLAMEAKPARANCGCLCSNIFSGCTGLSPPCPNGLLDWCRIPGPRTACAQCGGGTPSPTPTPTPTHAPPSDVDSECGRDRCAKRHGGECEVDRCNYNTWKGSTCCACGGTIYGSRRNPHPFCSPVAVQPVCKAGLQYLKGSSKYVKGVCTACSNSDCGDAKDKYRCVRVEHPNAWMHVPSLTDTVALMHGSCTVHAIVDKKIPLLQPLRTVWRIAVLLPTLWSCQTCSRRCNVTKRSHRHAIHVHNAEM